MDIMTIIKEANPNVVIFLLTTFVAFISWLVKSLVEKPLTESKNTFTKYFDKRIEILTEVKTRLNFIAYFPEGDESLEYKNQLQTILLTDGKAAYLSKEVYDNVLRIAIDPKTDEKLLLATIINIDEELYKKISKVQDEIIFYRSFSNYSPIKRFVGITILSLQYIIALTLVFSTLFYVTILFIDSNLYQRIGIFVAGIFGIYLLDKWLKR
ncbi:hypothetical protein [Lascolabacillus massiliensis]|jgi:hypothetical protein|uniref:hypothetical protein n=1 Tax=Lascolabacillus massiliensis TaxID=1627894 RepID=UPI0006B30376|nr:hypothetical protein [Lascolabacillus massiliensis]